MAQKMTGALVFDERTDRYDIRLISHVTTSFKSTLFQDFYHYFESSTKYIILRISSGIFTGEVI